MLIQLFQTIVNGKGGGLQYWGILCGLGEVNCSNDNLRKAH